MPHTASPCEDGDVKRPIGLPRHTTTAGHYAVLPPILFAVTLDVGNHFGSRDVVFGYLGFNSIYLGFSMTGMLILVYLAWLLLVIRKKVTAATGGGLALAAHALALRAAAGCGESVLPWFGREYLQEKPVYGVLDAAYGLSVVAYATGLAFVVAACIAEWQLRRVAPDWAVPE